MGDTLCVGAEGDWEEGQASPEALHMPVAVGSEVGCSCGTNLLYFFHYIGLSKDCHGIRCRDTPA